jgi:hypothetical protein
MRDADWTSLVYAVERGKCTLMLGPDAVVGTLDGARLPVHQALATFVRDRLGPLHQHLDPAKPASVAQAAIELEDPFSLQGWVSEFYGRFEVEDAVLRELAGLPFEVVVSTSPGLSVDRVFRDVKPNTTTDFYDRTARAKHTLPEPSVAAPLVYQLYGSLEQPSSLILSESDRLEFIVAIVADEPPLHPRMRSLLCDPERSFLFLGFDLAQWQFRVLLHVLSGEAQRRYKSFAFEREDSGLDPETQAFYRSGHKIHFVGSEIAAFTSELAARVTIPTRAPDEVGHTSVHSTEPGTDIEPPPDAPIVFLCHATPDKETVKVVAHRLRASGIQVWFDRDDLRGGDRWDAKIRRAISHDVDYLVVLQSEHLIERDVSYANREIELALDRQQMYRAPRRFLIPAVLDDPANRLAELDHLQSVDLSVPEGIDELIRTIKRDLNIKLRQAG